MKKEQKNHKKDLRGLKALNDAQLLSIKGGDDDDDEQTAVVLDNGCCKAG